MTVLNDNGAFLTGYSYDEFGVTEQYGDTNFDNEICYTGGIYDKSTGEYYLNARYYDLDDGRFLNMDTYRGDNLNPKSLHLYTYTENDRVPMMALKTNRCKSGSDKNVELLS